MKNHYYSLGFDLNSNHDFLDWTNSDGEKLCWRLATVHSHHLIVIWGRHWHQFQALRKRWRRYLHENIWHKALIAAIRNHNRQAVPMNHLTLMALERSNTCSETIDHLNFVEFLHLDLKSISGMLDNVLIQSIVPSRTRLPFLWPGSSGLEANYHSQDRDVQPQLEVNSWTVQTKCGADATAHT